MPDIQAAVDKIMKTTKRILEQSKNLAFSEEEYELQKSELDRHGKYLSYSMGKGHQDLMKNCKIACCVIGHLENIDNNKMFKKQVINGGFDMVCIDEAGFVKLQEKISLQKL